MAYRVVIFTDEEEIAVVSSQWWTPETVHKGNGEAFWPPCKSDAGLNKALAEHREPSDGWTKYAAKCVFVTDDLLRAREKAKDAEYETDVTSSKEDNGRRKKKNPRYESSDEEQAQSLPHALPSARGTGGSTAHKRKAPRCGSLSDSSRGFAGGSQCPEKSALVTPPRAPASLYMTAGVANGPRPGSSKQLDVNKGASALSIPGRSSEDVVPCEASKIRDRKIGVTLARILKTVEANQQSIGTLTAEVRSLREAHLKTGASLPRLPVQSMDELEDLNKLLRDEKLSARLTEQLKESLSATATLRQNTRFMLQGLLGSDLGSQLSLSGRNGKSGIANTRVFTAIYGALKIAGIRVERGKLNRAIAKWLSGSRDRNGGRAKRMARRLQKEQAEVVAARLATNNAVPPVQQPPPPPGAVEERESDASTEEVEVPFAMF